VDSSNPFVKPVRLSDTRDRRDFYLSAGIHAGILLILITVGLLAGGKSIPMGGGEYVSVEMVVFDTGDVPSEAIQEEIHEPVEEVPEEVVEIVEEVVEEVPSEIIEPVEEVPAEVAEPTEEVQVESVTPSSSEFISVSSQGEAGGGAPGPASYEGRVFSAIRRNFRTAVDPAQSYRISFTVNLDGTHSYEVIRTSGDSGFDRAVTHALNNASIPPVPPGRTSPVNLQIEFFGPE